MTMKFHFRIGAAILAATCGANPAAAQAFKPLWSFGSAGDGQLPAGALVGRAGRLFGATQGGGDHGYGTVYMVDDKGQERVLHSFANGADGGIPAASLVKVGQTLYGTNQIGGTTGNGVVFAIDIATGACRTIYSFSGGLDGGSPLAGVLYREGVLYGTAFLGGSHGAGTAFKIDLASSGSAMTVLHSFGGGRDGNSPQGDLIVLNGVLYGTTEVGGRSNAGTVYALDPVSGAERVVYSLDSSFTGGAPQAGLVNVDGELYGTASNGGSANAGTVFKVNAATGKAALVHSFSGGTDGQEPLTPLTLVAGELYGTTNFGGSHGDGIVFSLSVRGQKLRVLHAFTGKADGKYPQGALLYSEDALYGTAGAGGTFGTGTAFRLAPWWR